MRIILQIVVCQECEKDYKNIRHGTASHKIAFAIAILDTLIHCEFLLTHCSLPHAHVIATNYASFNCFTIHLKE